MYVDIHEHVGTIMELHYYTGIPLFQNFITYGCNILVIPYLQDLWKPRIPENLSSSFLKFPEIWNSIILRNPEIFNFQNSVISVMELYCYNGISLFS